ncbi:TonB-dependent receptor [Dysgonomonas sp. 216]|uniref:TonB-dependent receptor plug domain-containing protein n=1 Tax=Dysgonomonas sp. 216 TaxID=2302934 RepID=UPI0013D1E641|nr:TonB-dependent receptor [Dysgonomonas sp. 216]NDW18040.1 TonB-dependent receptor [Dysgonomonas sp. 216]
MDRSLCFFIVILFFAITSTVKADSISTKYIDEITVTSAIKPSASLSGAPLQVLTSDDITNSGFQSMSDAVRRFAGVAVKDYGGIGGLKTVSIRGLGSQHSGISYDGIPMGDSQSGQIDIGRFSLDNVALLNFNIGLSNDIFQSARQQLSAGSLNITTLQPSFSEKKNIKQVQIKTGSFGFFEPSLYYAQQLNSNWAASANGAWQRADGKYPHKFNNGSYYEDRKRSNSDTDIWRGEFNIYGKTGKTGSLNFKVHAFDSERGLPQKAMNGSQYSNERLWNTDFFTQALYENKLNKKIDIKGTAKFTRNYTRYTNNSIKDTTRNNFTQYEYYISGVVSYTPLKQLSFSIAQDYIRSYLDMDFGRKEKEGDAFPSTDKAYRNSYLTAINAQFNTKKLILTASLLGAYYDEDVKKKESPENKKRLSPALSVSYKPFDYGLRFRASYKDGYRIPTFNDMYYTHVGNINLRPELAKQYNIGITWVTCLNNTFNFLNITADAYQNNIKDKIVALPSMFVWKMMNVDNVTIKGLDITASSDILLSEKLTVKINGNYSFQQAENDDTNDQLPYIPKHSGGMRVGIDNPWINLSYSFIACSSQYSELMHSKQVYMKAYADQTISANKTFKISGSIIRLQGDIVNLSGKNYEVIKGYPMPGRSFRISTSCNF